MVDGLVLAERSSVLGAVCAGGEHWIQHQVHSNQVPAAAFVARFLSAAGAASTRDAMA